jgi:hypothetical protein
MLVPDSTAGKSSEFGSFIPSVKQSLANAGEWVKKIATSKTHLCDVLLKLAPILHMNRCCRNPREDRLAAAQQYEIFRGTYE